ncbi:DUF2255 family protein [Nocardia noduli]|uniref:DUF2255 family protein n=1 Tax=Nocardia noduli TaxID=2815722 RepID=UPI001C226CD8|nr:DUF2255 family protein [Nocardia noduli]
MTAWPPTDQTLLSDTPTLILNAGENDGPGVEVGMVLIDGELWVRAYRGVDSHWYRAAQDSGWGMIRVAGTVHRVVLLTTDAETPPGLDVAFRSKYGQLADILDSPQARAATLRIDPAPSPDPPPSLTRDLAAGSAPRPADAVPRRDFETS